MNVLPKRQQRAIFNRGTMVRGKVKPPIKKFAPPHGPK
jgi:hypothetical protein